MQGDRGESHSEGMDGQEIAYPAKGIWVWQLEVAYTVIVVKKNGCNFSSEVIRILHKAGNKYWNTKWEYNHTGILRYHVLNCISEHCPEQMSDSI